MGLIRNLNPRRGICNGTRIIVVKITHLFIECSLIGHENLDATVVIPRIDMTIEGDESLPVAWKRLQFPLRLAFAMTLNKSQG